MGPLGKACKICTADQKQKSVKKVPEVPEWPTIVGNNQTGEVLQEATGLIVNGLTKAAGLTICHQNGLNGQPCLCWFPGFSTPRAGIIHKLHFDN